MERYLRRTPLGGLMDRLGLRLLAFMLSTVFFVLLWGARPLSFLAGAALGILLLLLIKEGEKKRLKSREKKLRSVLGGELTLEKLLLAAPKKAHFETVMILSSAYQMTLLRTLDEGVLCEIKGENVLIALLQKHPSERCGAQDVLAFQRTVRAYKAIRGVLCLACKADENARAQSQRTPPVTLFSKESFARLAGGMNPATDEQLVELGRRRRERAPGYVLLRRILSRDRAPRYALYGSLLLLLYVLTNLPYYPAPGIALVLLAAFSRCVPQENEAL